MEIGGQKDIPATDRVRISYDCAGWGDRARSDARKATLVGTQAVRMQRTGAMTLAMVTLDFDWTAASDKYELWFSPEVAKVMKGVDATHPQPAPPCCVDAAARSSRQWKAIGAR
ncbi:hypothetical protein GCM10027599_17880 [Yimella radicis]